MTARYATLFEARIQHDYFLNLGSRVHEALNDEARRAVSRQYSVPGFLEVFPTWATRRALAGHKAMFRATSTGFFIAIAADTSSAGERPLLPPAADVRLRFALAVRDRRFFNYTALPAGAPGFYRFANDSGNEVAGQRFLSRPVPAFEPDRAYEAGEVRAATGPGGTVDLLRAERDTGPSATPVAADWRRIPPDTFDPGNSYAAGAVVFAANRSFRALVDGPGADLDDTTEWEPLGSLANQYVTAADSRALRPARFDLELGAAALPRATVRLLRSGDSTLAWERLFTAVGGNLERVTLDLGATAAGAYRLEVRDAAGAVVGGPGLDLYLDPEAVRERWFGIVEIGPGSGGTALLAGDGTLRSPVYTLRFLNRATRWRYIFPAPQEAGAGADVAPEGGDPRVLVTAASRPLTRLGTGVLLQADLESTPTASEEVLLPEPETRSIRRQDSQWFSEVHTINLPL